MTNIPAPILLIADSYKVKVSRDGRRNGASYACSCGICLGQFDDPGIELVAFFHELGHALSGEVTKRGRTMSTLSSEGLAWELGLGLAFSHGYEWDHNSKEMVWARQQLKSYTLPPFDNL